MVKSSMHLFMISLPDDPRRRQSGLSKIHPLNLPYEVVDGVEASKWRIDQLPVSAKTLREMRIGEIGCYLAHLRALRRVVDYRLPWACILEDDFCFEPEPDFGLVEIGDALPREFDYIHLQRNIDQNSKFRVVEKHGAFNRVCETPLGTVGYLISHGLAKYILDNHARCKTPIDHLYAKLSHQGLFYAPVKPLVGVQLGLDSAINP
ncbi:glycosyltransferase family 25 protein [Novipirellula sp. SH528]|uniref:glycosyltransferase family 25 protein n=1 Tax=Novipirellula sp. SH528 TaxID=3454466 RepID=UPI003FA0625D